MNHQGVLQPLACLEELHPLSATYEWKVQVGVPLEIYQESPGQQVCAALWSTRCPIKSTRRARQTYATLKPPGQIGNLSTVQPRESKHSPGPTHALCNVRKGPQDCVAFVASHQRLGASKVRRGPATWLQPRLPHGLHRHLSSIRVCAFDSSPHSPQRSGGGGGLNLTKGEPSEGVGGFGRQSLGGRVARLGFPACCVLESGRKGLWRGHPPIKQAAIGARA